MQTIKSSCFTAEIDEHGAQLTHLYHNEDHFDYIWNNPLWEKHAPILFPAIGRSNNDANFGIAASIKLALRCACFHLHSFTGRKGIICIELEVLL